MIAKYRGPSDNQKRENLPFSLIHRSALDWIGIGHEAIVCGSIITGDIPDRLYSFSTWLFRCIVPTLSRHMLLHDKLRLCHIKLRGTTLTNFAFGDEALEIL